MQRSDTTPDPITWLEVLLDLAAIALLFQLFPSLFRALDVRNWSQLTWFVVNVGVVLALMGARFVPNWAKDWQQDRQERRNRNAKERARAEKAIKLKQQREALERMRASRSRRIY